MHRSQTTPRRRRGRRTATVVAIGAVLGLAPIWPATLEAQAPSIAVTGLARGARGEEVRALQQALVSQGVTVVGGVDGIFGPGTETALRSFQSSKGLPATGVVDEASAIALGLSSSPYLGLTQGNTGDAVRQLQQRLIELGHRPSGGADGIFGTATSAALGAFQTATGLAATGTVDPATAAALGQAAPAASQPVASQPAASQPAASQPAASQPAASQPAADASAGGLVGLKIGARGETVATLQRAIMAAGFTVVGGADGVFGVLTANALRSFQNANGLGVTGVVDDATAALLAQVAGGAGAHDPTVTASPLLGLRYGSIGADVKALQQALIGAGFRPRGGADGVFGAATATSLKQYQATRGLTPSGVVDEATANALASAGGGGGQASPLVGLKAGSLGNTVKQLQEALIAAGVNVRGGADGIFGPATQNSLKAFQRSQGLPETGVVDDATAAALANPKTPVGDPGEGGGFAEFGEKGERVVALQSALVNAGIALRGGVDGSFGGGTAAAVMDFQRQRGLAVTGKVDAATGAALGLTAAAPPAAPDPAAVTLAAFPVQGRCYFGDSWGYPRSGGRVHLGVDIIASPDKLIYAVADGRITKVYQDYPGSLAGNGVRLTLADGTYFFYAHMSRIADGIELEVPVKAGQIIGYVGRTGNAGTDHLHFEIHPRGGAAVNPYPIVKAIDGCGNTEPLPQP